MEEGGLPITAGLKVSELFKPNGCRFGYQTCMIEEGKDCSAMGVIYKITCDACQETIKENDQEVKRHPGGQPGPNYVGLTATSIHCRMASHFQRQI